MRGRACEAIQMTAKLKGWDPTDMMENAYTYENLDCNHPLESWTRDLQPTNPAVIEPQPYVAQKSAKGGNPYPGMDMGY